jgi:Glycosyl hydrolases family 25
VSLYGIDISNHQTMAYRSTWPYQGADFVIVQAIAPPSPFTGWEIGGYTAEQLRAARDDDKAAGAYVWLWNSFSTSAATKADIASRLALIPDDVPLDMRLWLDMEDTTQDHGPPRQQDVLDALEVMDEWAIDHGLPLTGVYSGDWYIRGYMDAWFPPDRVYWQANYAHTMESAEAALLPARPMIQYTSDPIDQNVMLESEVVGWEVPDVNCDAYKAAIERAVNRLQIELARRTPAGRVKPLSRPLVTEIQNELYQALRGTAS